MNSQLENTNSKGDFVLNRFETFVLKIFFCILEISKTNFSNHFFSTKSPFEFVLDFYYTYNLYF